MRIMCYENMNIIFNVFRLALYSSYWLVFKCSRTVFSMRQVLTFYMQGHTHIWSYIKSARTSDFKGHFCKYLIRKDRIRRQILCFQTLITRINISNKTFRYSLKLEFCLIFYLKRKRPLGRPRRRWVDNIRMDLQEVGCGYVDWIGLAQDRDRWRTLVSGVMNLRVP